MIFQAVFQSQQHVGSNICAQKTRLYSVFEKGVQPLARRVVCSDKSMFCARSKHKTAKHTRKMEKKFSNIKFKAYEAPKKQ